MEGRNLRRVVHLVVQKWEELRGKRGRKGGREEKRTEGRVSRKGFKEGFQGRVSREV